MDKEKLRSALENYYEATNKFSLIPLIDPKILEHIAEQGKHEYQEEQDKFSGEVDLSEVSTIRESEIKESDVENYSSFVDTLYGIAERLWGVRGLRFGKIVKVMGCNSVPVKVKIRPNVLMDVETAMYVKRSNIYDNPRPLGIELFSLIGGFVDCYNYLFDGDVVVEEAIRGMHLPYFPIERRTTEEFIKARIGLDLLVMYAGIQDTKVDNYVIAEHDCAHIMVDFELLGITPWQKFHYLRETSLEKLGINPFEYDDIFEELEQNLAYRLEKKMPKLRKLLNVFKEADLGSLATDIEERAKSLMGTV